MKVSFLAGVEDQRSRNFIAILDIDDDGYGWIAILLFSVDTGYDSLLTFNSIMFTLRDVTPQVG